MASKLIKVTPKQRREMRLAASENRRRKQIAKRMEEARRAPGACAGCGAPPCGHLRPERCCTKCSHTEPEGWRATHRLYERGVGREVMALEGVARVFVRADGVVEWLEWPPGDDGRPRVLYLGAVPHSPGAWELSGSEGGSDGPQEEEDEDNEFNRYASFSLEEAEAEAAALYESESEEEDESEPEDWDGGP